MPVPPLPFWVAFDGMAEGHWPKAGWWVVTVQSQDPHCVATMVYSASFLGVCPHGLLLFSFTVSQLVIAAQFWSCYGTKNVMRGSDNAVAPHGGSVLPPLDHLDARKAGELSTLFDVGGIFGEFVTTCSMTESLAT